MDSKQRIDKKLLDNIKENLPKLVELMEEMSSHLFYEDPIYRFYHQSFKVYSLQEETKKMVEALKSLTPEGQTFCKEFQEIIDSGASGRKFEPKHNENWTSHTRIFVEAFFHAKFFLEMAIKYGKELKKAPSPLPSGWAALLCLYNIR